MGLSYPGEWKYEGVGITVPASALEDFIRLAEKIGTGVGIQEEKTVYEIFKSRFGTYSPSSNASWALTDMHSAISKFTGNAVEFVDMYWSAVCDVQALGILVPRVEQINKMLRSHGIPFVLEPPELRRTDDSFIISESAAQGQSSRMSYHLKEKIGEGGFGQVYRAVRVTEFGEFEFAVKLLNPSPFADREKAHIRFRRELKALRTLQHRAIISYIDAGTDGEGRPFLVMPLIEGCSIRDAVPRRDGPAAARLMLEVLEGLQYAHSKDVLHRDLKPNNILVRSTDRQPVIVDFGAAYLLDSSAQEAITTGPVGSLGYIPHEVIADPKLRTEAHDIYSCGVILYEIIAGHQPDPRDYKELSIVASSFKSLDQIIRRATAPLRDRYRTISCFTNEMRAFLEHPE